MKIDTQIHTLGDEPYMEERIMTTTDDEEQHA